jgi:hypothetical protein
MELVYFFCEPTVMRVPFFGYDWRLFGLLAAAGGGVWDNLRQEFVFKSKERTDAYDCNFFGIPCVKADETAPVPVSVSGFLERPWEENCPAGVPDITRAVNKYGRKPLSPAFSAPEKLSEYWRVKLETELRARKFSNVLNNDGVREQHCPRQDKILPIVFSKKVF